MLKQLKSTTNTAGSMFILRTYEKCSQVFMHTAREQNMTKIICMTHVSNK